MVRTSLHHYQREKRLRGCRGTGSSSSSTHKAAVLTWGKSPLEREGSTNGRRRECASLFHTDTLLLTLHPLAMSHT